MKIRTGFVSNSSSSSFLIYGTTMSDEDIKAAVVKSGIKLKSYDGKPMKAEDADDYELQEAFAEALKKKSGHAFESHNPEGCDAPYIGVSWDDVKDDETGKEFKTSIEKALSDLVGSKVECETHSECWYG